MPEATDGPASSLFHSIALKGGISFSSLEGAGISEAMTDALEAAPTGSCVCWGMPFDIRDPLLVAEGPVSVAVGATRARWVVFLHTADAKPLEWNADGFISPTRGQGWLGEHAADYVILYSDGTEERVAVRRRHEIGAFRRTWGENCFESVPHRKPRPVRAHHEQTHPQWGFSQTRAMAQDLGRWTNWLWAWENKHPDRDIVGFRFEPVSGSILVSAISAGDCASTPLRWERRRKAILILPEGEEFQPELDERGVLAQVQLDMGRVISATPRLIYPKDRWHDSHNNQLPEVSENELVVEYTAHNEACFHGTALHAIPLSVLESDGDENRIKAVSPAWHRVQLRVAEQKGGAPVSVKLHVHGEAGEYLPPVDRHRIPNASWFEDYSADFSHRQTHHCTYIPGETSIDLPLGTVYIEISKGFEISPLRKKVEVTAKTEELLFEIERVLPWRERGWITADTHVHFLSPTSALLEGAGEGVNVVNLLASQWGELMTNVGDFDGKTTWGSPEAGGDGEYLVRVGTENRQHVLGHISLLGYEGGIIAPMTTGGVDESALGDPVEILLTEWARQCRKQGGVVILPHFPNPRAEAAVAITTGEADGVEMTSWGNLYGGIDPYSLADWYRYLNCGYFVAAVGGTDKMSAATAVGTVRTYAHVDPGKAFTYESWKAAIKDGQTFVTYGPLVEFTVDGIPMGGRIEMESGGGSVDVVWEVASVTVPMTRVELVVNGEIRESVSVKKDRAAGSWRLRLNRSSWLALLVRGHHQEKPEIIAAHSSPVMVAVEGTPFYAAADALTILEQIEGALAYLDTIGTRAETAAYRRMHLLLESAHRDFHNRMHQMGSMHDHTPIEK
jgi:hypothetical protein